MKCFWCGSLNTNLEIDENGQVLKHFPCNACNQPERSKREDFFVTKGSGGCLVQDAIPSEECKEYHENSYIQANGKLRRCGALNSRETD